MCVKFEFQLSDVLNLPDVVHKYLKNWYESFVESTFEQ